MRVVAAFMLMAVTALMGSVAVPAYAADAIKIGLLKTTASGAIYLAQERGYFTDEGLTAEIVSFDAAEPIAVAAVSGAVDFGAIGTSVGMFNLGAQGGLKLIGGQSREYPGFQTLAVLVSNKAYDAGLKTFKDIGNHTVAVAQFGSGTHYSISLIAMKYGIDLATVRILPVQSISNQLSAIAGGQTDLTVTAGTPALPAIGRGDARLLGWVGDEVSWQLGAIFVSTKLDTQRHDLVERFLRAFRRGAHDYHQAFADADDHRHDGPTAPEVLAVIAKYLGQPVDRLKNNVAYIDPEARLDLADMQRQIDWFRSQNLLKGSPKIADMIDKAAVIPLPAK